jgi:hypothetical protein
MKLEALAELIVADGLGVIGQTLFVYQMPASCKSGIVLRLPPTGNSLNHYIPGYISGKFQVIIRDTSYEAGNEKSNRLSKLFTFFEPKDFLDEQNRLYMRINQCFPCNTPIIYPRLENNLVEWSITFDVNFIEL